MNRPMRKLIAFSAAAAMLANIPLLGADAKYVAEQITDKEFESVVEYPDRNVYIENGTAQEFPIDQQLVVVGTDGTTKLITLDDAITSGICYASTTMGIYDFIMPTTTDYGFNFLDPNYRFGTAKDTMIVCGNKGDELLDKDGKVVAVYHAIKRLSDTYFTVFDTEGKVGVIDADGKVIIELTDTVKNIFLCIDGKKFFINGKEGDYFTDLKGKTVSPVYESAAQLSKGGYYYYWLDNYSDSYYNEPGYNYTLSKYFKIKKGDKYAVIDSTDFKQVTDYFDILSFKEESSRFEWCENYFIKASNQLFDENNEPISGKYSYEYFDENFNSLGQFSDSVDSIKDYSYTTLYYHDEKGEDISRYDTGDFKGGTVRYILHRGENGYDKLLDNDRKTLLEGDNISADSFYVRVEKDGKSVYYNGKLDKLGEFDSLSLIGNRYVATVGDKCVIYNRFLDEVINDNASADMSEVKYVDYMDYNTDTQVEYYFIKDDEDNVKIFDKDMKSVTTVKVTEEQNYYVCSDYRVFVYDNEYDRAYPVGDCFYLRKSEGDGKVVDIDGKLVAEIPSDYGFVVGSGIFYKQVGSELSFYNYKGEFIRKFDSYSKFSPMTPGEYTFVINGKDEESGKTASYIYNVKKNEVLYSQVGKYNNIERLGDDYVRTIVYPENVEADAETNKYAYLWTNDDGYKIGLDKIDGTQLVAPMNDLTVNVEEYCYAGYADANKRANTIDSIYSDGISPYVSKGPYDLPATGNNDSGYFVFNSVYVPIKDFALDVAKNNSFGIAIKTQFDNYIIINDGKWGMADADGKVICEPKYSRIYEFAGGIAFAEVSEPITYTTKQYKYDEETGKGEDVEVEENGRNIYLGLISKDGNEILKPEYNGTSGPNKKDELTRIYRYEDTFYVQKGTFRFDEDTYKTIFSGNDYVYKGEYYYNDFNKQYGYDSAIPCGDLYIVRKNGLTGIVSADNEVVLPIEYANILYVPSGEKMVTISQGSKMKNLVADERFSSPIVDLDDGSKLVNAITKDDKIKAYQIREIEETTTSTTATTTSATASTTTSSVAATSTSATTTEPVTTKPEQVFVGTWSLTKAESEDPDAAAEYEGVTITLTFNEDGTGKLVSLGGEEPVDDDFTWKLEDKKLTIESKELASTTFTYDPENYELSLVDSTDVKLSFKKKDELPLGDINGDNKIDAKDASAILVEYSKMSTGGESEMTAAQKAAANVNGDDKVDAKDASTILAYYALVSTSSGDVPSLKDFAAPKES